MRTSTLRLITAAAVAVILSLTLAPQLHAGTIAYTFTGSFDVGPLQNDQFSGAFTYDDAALTGVGSESAALQSFSLDWDGPQLTGALMLTDAATAQSAFTNGIFLGVSATFPSSNPTFTMIAGFFDPSEAFVAYDAAIPLPSGVGAGSIDYTRFIRPAIIPEPAAAVILAALPLCLTRRR